MGLLGYKDTWIISSNEESGDGYSDILVRSEDEEIGIVIEVKYAENGKLEEACQEALQQIERKGYQEELQEEGIEHILKYVLRAIRSAVRLCLLMTDLRRRNKKYFLEVPPYKVYNITDCIIRMVCSMIQTVFCMLFTK